MWKVVYKTARKFMPGEWIASFLRFLGRPLSEFGYNIYSQNGEDGIIEEMFLRLGVRGGWIVEFGAWDGIRYSNTYRLVERPKGFIAVYFEGDKDRYGNLEDTAARSCGRIVPVCSYVQPEGEHSLARLLTKTSVPSDFELLSIDVDGMDYHIWDKFERFAPKVVIIDINSSIPPDREQVHGPEKQGSSFRSMLELGARKGYTLACHTGNMIFVRNDLVGRLKLAPKYLSNPELLFLRDWLPEEFRRK